MLRCVAMALTLGFLAPALHAQGLRKFPATALRGEIVVTQPPELLLNKHASRFAPGARILGQNNMLVLSGALVGQRLIVHYTVDPQGFVHDVWILTPAELAKKPWPSTPQQAAAWVFDPNAQMWTSR